MVRTSEFVVSCEALAVSLSLAGFYIYGNGSKLPLEVLFPGHILYYLLTFSFSSPGAYHIRKFVCVFGLVFGDMLLTAGLLHKALPSSFSVLCLQFIVVFTVVHLLEPVELKTQLSVHGYRGLLFILEGVLKSYMLVSTIQEVLIIFKEDTYRAVIGSILLGSMRLLLAPCIYAIDQYCSVSASVNEVTREDMMKHLRLAPTITLVALVLLLRTLPTSLAEMQETGYTFAHCLLNIAFVVWFAWDAVSYAQHRATN